MKKQLTSIRLLVPCTFIDKPVAQTTQVFTSGIISEKSENTGGTISGQLSSSTKYIIDGMTAKNPASAESTTSRSGTPCLISIEQTRSALLKRSFVQRPTGIRTL